MSSVKLILLILAAGSFLLSALEVKTWHVNPLGAGALFLTLALLVGG